MHRTIYRDYTNHLFRVGAVGEDLWPNTAQTMNYSKTTFGWHLWRESSSPLEWQFRLIIDGDEFIRAVCNLLMDGTIPFSQRSQAIDSLDGDYSSRTHLETTQKWLKARSGGIKLTHGNFHFAGFMAINRKRVSGWPFGSVTRFMFAFTCQRIYWCTAIAVILLLPHFSRGRRAPRKWLHGVAAMSTNNKNQIEWKINCSCVFYALARWAEFEKWPGHHSPPHLITRICCRPIFGTRSILYDNFTGRTAYALHIMQGLWPDGWLLRFVINIADGYYPLGGQTRFEYSMESAREQARAGPNGFWALRAPFNAVALELKCIEKVYSHDPFPLNSAAIWIVLKSSIVSYS